MIGVAGQATILTTIQSIDPMYCYVDVNEQAILKYQQLAKEEKRVSARDARIPTYMGLANEDGFPHAGVVDFVDNKVARARAPWGGGACSRTAMVF